MFVKCLEESEKCYINPTVKCANHNVITWLIPVGASMSFPSCANNEIGSQPLFLTHSKRKG